MEERLEAEREDHRKALDQLRDECKSYVIYLFIFFGSLAGCMLSKTRDDVIHK